MIKIFLTAAIIFLMQTSAEAYGIFWYDMNSDLPKWKKVVIFPLANSNDKNNWLISRDENSLLYFQNKWLMNRFEKKIKNMHTVRLAPGIKEKDEILIDKFSILLNPYPDEKTRATAVFEQTGADMYIFPRFRENKMEKVISPKTEVEVEARYWTQIVGSKDHDGVYDMRTVKEQHVIPEHEYYEYALDLELEGFDSEGNQVFLFNDFRRDAAQNLNVWKREVAESLYRNIIYYLRKDFADLKSDKNRNKVKNDSINIGFKNLKLPPEVIYDEYALKGLHYRMKSEALKVLKDVNIILDNTEAKNADYYVTGNIREWKFITEWIPPTVVKLDVNLDNSISFMLAVRSGNVVILNSEESEWQDGTIKRKMYTLQCKDALNDEFGHWNKYWKVQADFQLVNAKTGERVVSLGDEKITSFPMVAYKEVLNSFYEQVNKYFGK